MLTILVPSYNHENYIGQCLSAVCQVKIPGLKIIVIDDGSTDKTVENARAVLALYPELDVELIEKSNSGLVSSLNIGLGRASTEYLYLVASDDIPEPLGILRCIEALIAEPQAQFCVGGALNFFEESGSLSSVYTERHNRFFNLAIESRSVEVFTNFPSPVLLQSTLFRTAALRSIGGWDPKLIWDDYPTFVKLFSMFPVVGRDFFYLPDVVVVKYRHHGSNTYKNVAKQFYMYLQAIEALAPAHLRDFVLAGKGGYYILSGVRYGDLKGVLKIFSLLPPKALLKVPFIMANLAFRKLLKNDGL